ncbi:hypothetical protein, partial [Rhizobium leguminosarum]|uniref:hypothetical protein n=1 Tax=Rhizobium leguminosarum TaxID=384 RepID=UPI003F966A9B
MTRKNLDFRADAYRHVLGFVFHHWRHRPALLPAMASTIWPENTGTITSASVLANDQHDDNAHQY